MAFKFVTFAALLAVANAGVPLGYAAHGYAAAPVAHYSSAPSVSYAYTSSPAVAKVASPYAYAAPAYSTYSAPAYSTYAAPAVAKVATYAAPAYSTYSAPAYSTYAAPAIAKVASYAAPAYSTYSAPAYSTYAAPALAKYVAPVAYASPAYKVAEPVGPAVYDFGYSVNDPHTGDSKSQTESRRGDSVQGSYSLIEADGSKRVVEYTADAHNGFNAVVHKEPAQVAVKTIAPVAYAAPAYPAVAKYAAPAYYH